MMQAVHLSVRFPSSLDEEGESQRTCQRTIHDRHAVMCEATLEWKRT